MLTTILEYFCIVRRWEYLGVVPRLVITPLTDKVVILIFNGRLAFDSPCAVLCHLDWGAEPLAWRSSCWSGWHWKNRIRQGFRKGTGNAGKATNHFEKTIFAMNLSFFRCFVSSISRSLFSIARMVWTTK
jgi:hypothetical protein